MVSVGLDRTQALATLGPRYGRAFAPSVDFSLLMAARDAHRRPRRSEGMLEFENAMKFSISGDYAMVLLSRRIA